MRNNHPVSQQAYPFPKGRTLVSTTDLDGRIQHCNAAFIEVSGFSREELLGQPHNLIRHPDMPEEAFRDLWATIKSGRPWSGLVKNRRKNGDHYWVQANVTPLLAGGRPTAFMSVRTEPSAAHVRAAEQLYARMRAEQQGGQRHHMLQRGRLSRRDWRGRLAGLGSGSPWLKRWAGYALLAGAGLAAGMGSWPLTLELSGLTMLTLGLSLLHQRQTQASLQPALNYASQIAAGDLSQPMKPSGHAHTRELETALNQLAVNIRAMVSDTRSEMAAMSSSTHLIAQGNKDLAQRTETQAASLEQTAAAMEQITGTVRSSTDTADQASSVVASLSQQSGRSAEVVDHAKRSMSAIAGSSKRIAEIIAVIDSIAFQTNILALNAAVESARAGEHGRGFAVVASEVRALAQRSSTAAREIAQLIHDSAEKVDDGERHTETARLSINSTLRSVQDFSQLIGQIHHSAQEQLTGITQINQAINHMEQITVQNADMVQALSNSAQQLSHQVNEVTTSLRVFKLA